MNFAQASQLPAEQIAKNLETSLKSGLTGIETEKRLKIFGLNQVKLKPKKWYHFLLRQFKSAFIYLLLGASGIAFLLGEKTDGSMILFFVGVNVILGFYQEFKSGRILEALQNLMTKTAKVLRDGQEITIDAKNLVLGDIVLIETGDIVPADLRLVVNQNLVINESSLTGESKGVEKQTSEISDPITNYYEALNIVFSGTEVVSGKGYGIVIATGKDTEFGKLTKLSAETISQNSFEKKINSFSRFVLIITLVTIFLVFSVHILFKKTVPIGDLVVFSVALAVGVIPEAMPLVTTFSLSKSANLLSKKSVVVKRLTSIEDLGGIQVLCTDKTGTLTENVLKVSEIFSQNPQETAFFGVLEGAPIKENGFLEDSLTKRSAPTLDLIGNSFYQAILEFISPEWKNLALKYKKIFEIPFSPQRKRSSLLAKGGNRTLLIVKGAPEAIIPLCATGQENIKGLNTQTQNEYSWLSQQGKSGKRVLAIATKTLDQESFTEKDEKELTLNGFISFEDPIKPTAYKAVAQAQKMGVKIKILTGDGLDVAQNVAIKTGIAQDLNQTITGEDFFALPPEEQDLKLAEISVFARVSPEQKTKIIQMLQKKLEVGYLGDGINDAPALKSAGVAIVVNTAADISKEVADIVLLKKDLKVITDGIEMGRKTYINVTNYIKATLSSNFGNFYTMAFATLIMDSLPMLPTQILLLNLLSDFPMVSIASDNVEKEEIRNPQSYNTKESLILASLLGIVSTLFDFVALGIFSRLGMEKLRTCWFITSVATELSLIYIIRTKKPFFKAKLAPSIHLTALSILALGATLALPFTKLGQEVFFFVSPTTYNLLLILGIVLGYILTTELVKSLYFRYKNF